MDKYSIDFDSKIYESDNYFYSIFFKSLNISNNMLNDCIKIIDKKYIYKSILKQSKKLNISKKEIKNAYFKANIINKKLLKKDRIKRYNELKQVKY